MQDNLKLLFPRIIKELAQMSKHLHLAKGTKDEMTRNIFNVMMHNNNSDVNILIMAINCLDSDV